MIEPKYLTIGELARRVGVTVRTIQYYDQQGLLSPSAKGPQNQRLYTKLDIHHATRVVFQVKQFAWVRMTSLQFIAHG